MKPDFVDTNLGEGQDSQWKDRIFTSYLMWIFCLPS